MCPKCSSLPGPTGTLCQLTEWVPGLSNPPPFFGWSLLESLEWSLLLRSGTIPIRFLLDRSVSTVLFHDPSFKTVIISSRDRSNSVLRSIMWKLSSTVKDNLPKCSGLSTVFCRETMWVMVSLYSAFLCARSLHLDLSCCCLGDNFRNMDLRVSRNWWILSLLEIGFCGSRSWITMLFLRVVGCIVVYVDYIHLLTSNCDHFDPQNSSLT